MFQLSIKHFYLSWRSASLSSIAPGIVTARPSRVKGGSGRNAVITFLTAVD
jgi:hypothetical protein